MDKFLKIIIISFILLFLVFGVVKAIDGNYFAANFIGVIAIIFGLVGVIYIIIKGIKSIRSLCLLGIVITLQSCNYAKSNQQVVVSEDCGMTWKKINSGDAVPKGVSLFLK